MVDNTRIKEMQGELNVFRRLYVYIMINLCKWILLKSQNDSLVQPSTFVSYPRSMKLDFSWFTGDDKMTWLYKAEKFFTLYNTPDEQKVVIAFIHFKGKVLPWFQLLEKAHQVPDWLSLSTAMGTGIGVLLSQDNHPIAFCLKKMSPLIQKQSTYAREMYAITTAAAKFQHYLLGHHFIVRTDHNQKNANTGDSNTRAAGMAP